MSPHAAFILSAFPQGAAQVLWLRTQINGAGCNPGSRRFLPFSPLVTPTHPLNSSEVLTNCSNDRMAWPGNGKLAGPWRVTVLCAQPRAGVVLQMAQEMPPRIHAHDGHEARRCGAPPGEPSGPHLLRQGLCMQAAASQAPSGRPSPIFLVSINSGKIFKYTKA